MTRTARIAMGIAWAWAIAAAVPETWGQDAATQPTDEPPGSTVVRTDAFYIQTLSDYGGHRRLLRIPGPPELYVDFMTVGGAAGKLEYRSSADAGKSWLGDKSTVLGPSLQCGISTWADAQNNIYVLYDDDRNTLTCRKLTFEGDGKWTIGEKGNAGQSLAQFRAYMHSAICKEPGKEGKLWACWWEHGKDGAQEGTVKRLRVARSTDPDGLEKWSEPMDPLPSSVPAVENETIACSFILLDGRPALFVDQGFYGKTGLSRWDGKQWNFEAVDLKKGLTKPQPARYCTYSVATDAAGVVHLAWNAQAEEGGIFYRQFKDGQWSNTTVLSANPKDRWPTITLVEGKDPLVIWCHPIKDAKDYRTQHEIVYKAMTGGKWEENEKVLVKDDSPQEDKSIMFPNTAVTSGTKIVFIYSYGGYKAGGKRTLKSGIIDLAIKR